MLKQPAYLYKNIQYLYTDLVTLNTGYRKMYAKTLKLYKGIDNTFEVKLLNGDQKLIDVVGYTVNWIMLDRDTAELVCKVSKEVQGRDNSLVSLTLSEGDLMPVKSGNYMYSTYLVSPTGTKIILYGDSQYGASVPVEVISNSFPQVYPSQVVTEFVNSQTLNYPQPDNSLYTSALDARPDNKGTNALHSTAIYATNFDGVVRIQITLEHGTNGLNQWCDLMDITVTTLDTLLFQNFNGVFTSVRFRVMPSLTNTGTVDKIIYRS